MYSFPNLEPVCCSMSNSNCWFLTCTQLSQEAGPVVWYSYLFQNFPQFIVIHTVKGFGIVNKADVFLELSCFFNDPADVGNLISGSSAFSKSSLNILKDDAVKVLHSICQQIWKTQQWPQDWKRSVFIPVPKKSNAKECSNYHTIALISHASKVMLKIIQARLQQYVNCELPDIQAGFEKAEEPEIKLPTSTGS